MKNKGIKDIYKKLANWLIWTHIDWIWKVLKCKVESIQQAEITWYVNAKINWEKCTIAIDPKTIALEDNNENNGKDKSK